MSAIFLVGSTIIADAFGWIQVHKSPNAQAERPAKPVRSSLLLDATAEHDRVDA
jgi:hypothetical protein